MADNDPLNITSAELSDQARIFLEGPVGRYITERIGEDIQSALDALEKVDPWGLTGRKKWRDAKFQLASARMVSGYLAEMLLSATPDELGEV